MKILFKFASRSRPQKFFAALDNICGLCTGKNFVILCSLDYDDPSMNTDAVRERIKQYPHVMAVWGYSKNKIDAVNRDVSILAHNDDWYIIICMSDDMVFLVPGFDTIIRNDMNGYFPDGDGVLQYWDQGTEDREFMTLSIMGRKFYNRFGYIYFPGYESVQADNEAVHVARMLGRYRSCPSRIVEHMHPVYNKTVYDAQYHKTEFFEVHHRDAALFTARKARNFDLTFDPIL